MISATVLAYKVHRRILQQQKYKRRCKQISLTPYRWMIIWLHRFIRLLPAYLIIFLIIYFIFQHIRDGPMWSQNNGIFGARCNKDDVWRQLLFISNFFPNECMPWMWYLALDTQFYMIAPIALLLSHTAPTYSIVLMIVIIIASVIYRATVMVLFRFPATIVAAILQNNGLVTEEMEKIFRYMYTTPQARIGSFLIGIHLGFLLSTKSKQTYSKTQIIIAHFISFASLSFSFFGANYATDFTLFSVFYAATFRVIWAFGLALFVWLCERGHMQMIYKCLASVKWVFFSRLSYGFYLSHEPILLYLIWTRRSAIMPLSSYYFIISAIEISLLSLLAAFLIAFVIEIPPLIIERKIFKKIRTQITSNDDKVKRGDVKEHKFNNVQLFHHQKNNESVELLPVISSMKRTKRWIEENHRDSPSTTPKRFVHDTDNQTHLIQTTTPTTVFLDNPISKSDGVLSTCKTFSTRSANKRETRKNKQSFCTPKSFATMPTKKQRQLQYADDDSDNSIRQTDTLMKKQFSYNQQSKILKPKQKIPLKQNYDKEVSLTENIGFSWIEEAGKKLDVEQNIQSKFGISNERIIAQNNHTNKHQPQHLNLYPLGERTTLSNKSSSSTTTGETIIHVKNENFGKLVDPAESYT